MEQLLGIAVFGVLLAISVGGYLAVERGDRERRQRDRMRASGSASGFAAQQIREDAV